MDHVKLLLRNGSLQQLLTSNNVLRVVVWCLLQDSIFLLYLLYPLFVFRQYKLSLTVTLIPSPLGYTLITYSIIVTNRMSEMVVGFCVECTSLRKYNVKFDWLTLNMKWEVLSLYTYRQQFYKQ